ncbi:MAG: trypsin-like peptidase domain-containing protein [Verrucomicrobiales bacterium]|nr:trypsin-like peptidase domain-containing protein [Verrucomicrobiales bacterium]
MPFTARTSWLPVLLLLTAWSSSFRSLAAADDDVDIARRLSNAFARVAETVSPAVVVVKVWPKESASTFDHGGLFRFLPEDTRRELEERLERDSRERRGEPDPEQGSGVIIREDGYVLTNGHVVENADRIEVRLKDGRRFPAEVSGIDKSSDLAVIKLKASGLPAARLGDSGKVRVGEFAIAIGAPFDLEYSVTFGHVSGKGRRVMLDVVMMDQDFIQTDASINPGNSGGPLVNIEGEVIGINTMIKGLNTGIGFAVPINLAKEVSGHLIQSGRFTRAWLGVSIESVGERPEAAPSGLPVKEGVVVREIVRDGPSWGSELETQDVIVAIDGEPVRDVGELKRQVSRKTVGKPIQVEVYRGGKKHSLTLTPGELPTDVMASLRPRRGMPAIPREDVPEPEAVPELEPSDRLGVKVKELDAANAARVGLDAGEGVLVIAVADDSPASARRIEPGDVITKINQRVIRKPKDIEQALKGADLAKGVRVTIVGEGGRRFEVLRARGE